MARARQSYTAAAAGVVKIGVGWFQVVEQPSSKFGAIGVSRRSFLVHQTEGRGGRGKGVDNKAGLFGSDLIDPFDYVIQIHALHVLLHNNPPSWGGLSNIHL